MTLAATSRKLLNLRKNWTVQILYRGKSTEVDPTFIMISRRGKPSFSTGTLQKVQWGHAPSSGAVTGTQFHKGRGSAILNLQPSESGPDGRKQAPEDVRLRQHCLRRVFAISS